MTDDPTLRASYEAELAAEKHDQWMAVPAGKKSAVAKLERGERDDQAYELRVKGFSLRQIGVRLGTDHKNAARMIERAAAARRPADAERRRDELGERLQLVAKMSLDVAENPPMVVAANGSMTAVPNQTVAAQHLSNAILATREYVQLYGLRMPARRHLTLAEAERLARARELIERLRESDGAENIISAEVIDAGSTAEQGDEQDEQDEQDESESRQPGWRRVPIETDPASRRGEL